MYLCTYFEKKIWELREVNDHEKSFREFAAYQIKKWKELYDNLLKNCSPNQCLLIVYEDIKKNIIDEMSKVMDFLGMKMTPQIKKCLLEQSNGAFKKKKRNKQEVDLIYKTISEEKIGIDLSSLFKTMKLDFEKKLRNHC